jgi:hypothetical protein
MNISSVALMLSAAWPVPLSEQDASFAVHEIAGWGMQIGDEITFAEWPGKRFFYAGSNRVAPVSPKPRYAGDYGIKPMLYPKPPARRAVMTKGPM